MSEIQTKPMGGEAGKSGWWLTVPTLLWLGVFFAIPTLLIFAVAFRQPDFQGNIGEGWSLEAVRHLGNTYYLQILWRTLWLAVSATVVTLLLALPVAYWLARLSSKWKPIMLLLVILPFWTNFLIRIFAWKTLLHPEGWIQKSLAWLGFIEPDGLLLYTPGAVWIVMIYTSLPFAILPLYAAAEKFDFQLLEAARDLGANAWGAFVKVFLPGIQRGIVVALLMVLIPAIGAYAIPDIVGGVNSEMIGNKIAQRIFTDRNLPQASALAGALALLVLLPLLAGAWWSRRRRL